MSIYIVIPVIVLKYCCKFIITVIDSYYRCMKKLVEYTWTKYSLKSTTETCTSWDGNKTIDTSLRLVTSFSFSGVIVCQCVYVADNALKKAILFTIKGVYMTTLGCSGGKM